MFDSLKVKILLTTWWRWSHSEAQGRRREAASERSVEQTYEPMYKYRIWGIRCRTSWPMTTKAISTKSRALVVNPAVACGRRSNLPREICRWSGIPDWGSGNRSWPDGRSRQRAY